MKDQQVGHYKILEKLGSGGMGEVWLAEDFRLGRKVALKFLAPSLSEDAGLRQRMIVEAQAAAAIDHPNVGVIYEVGETEDGRLFIAMAYYRSGSLKELLTSHPIEQEEAVRIACQVAAGLSAAHGKGILHRDVKPANIMMDEGGIPKLVDFGLAKVQEMSLTETGSLLGTIRYTSPEQVRGERADARSDVWALGVVLFEMLTGQIPFSGENDAAVLNSILQNNPTLPSHIRDEVSPLLNRILPRALAKDPKSRYQTAAALQMDMTSILDELIKGPKPRSAAQNLMALIRQPRVAISVTLILISILGLLVTTGIQRHSERRFQTEEIPELLAAIETQDFGTALLISTKLEQRYPGDPRLESIKPMFAHPVAFTTDPPGADVYVRTYSMPESTWVLLGKTPILRGWLPGGVIILRFEHPSCEPFELVELSGLGVEESAVEDSLSMPDTYEVGVIPLPTKSVSRTGMAIVKRWRGATPITATFINFNIDGQYPGYEYLMDEHEVSNQEYYEFVNAGGYEKQEYWKVQFIKDGHSMSWIEAMTMFRDRTGRPGPATWSGGTYDEDRANHPVGGLSWYEAAAYAEFRGLNLPTVYHWRSACATDLTQDRSWTVIARAGNFDTTDTVTRGSTSSVGPYGLWDMAGNVREWCWNASGDTRFILGGSYGDVFYQYMNAQAVDSFDRSPNNGFRCADYLDWDESTLEQAMSELVLRTWEPELHAPCSDEVFAAYSDLFRYDPVPLEANTVAIDSAHYWIREIITYRTVYDDDLILAYLFLPRNVKPPYQTLIYWGGSEAKLQPTSEGHYPRSNTRFLLERGRAVFCPVYLGTHERKYGSGEPPQGTRALVGHYVRMIQDFMRSVDYLQEREDIDASRIGFIGFSWGAATPGLISLALEDRIKVGVFFDGGLFGRTNREISAVNYAPRVTTPLLMINGEYDLVHRYEIHQRPLYEQLGMPEHMKKWVTYEGGHVIIATHRQNAIDEVLSWLDQWLGPVFN